MFFFWVLATSIKNNTLKSLKVKCLQKVFTFILLAKGDFKNDNILAVFFFLIKKRCCFNKYLLFIFKIFIIHNKKINKHLFLDDCRPCDVFIFLLLFKIQFWRSYLYNTKYKFIRFNNEYLHDYLHVLRLILRK